jgi:hypothetical protein
MARVIQSKQQMRGSQIPQKDRKMAQEGSGMKKGKKMKMKMKKKGRK